MNEKSPKEALQDELDKNPFFITAHNSTGPILVLEKSQQLSISKKASVSNSRRNNNLYHSQANIDASTRLGENSLMDPSSYLNLSLSGSPGGLHASTSVIKVKNYTIPATTNMKFDQFLDIMIFDANLQK